MTGPRVVVHRDRTVSVGDRHGLSVQYGGDGWGYALLDEHGDTVADGYATLAELRARAVEDLAVWDGRYEPGDRVWWWYPQGGLHPGEWTEAVIVRRVDPSATGGRPFLSVAVLRPDGTPSMGTPSMGTPSMGTPSMGTATLVRPGTGALRPWDEPWDG